MSPEVVAALIGVALGLFGERFLRSWGRLWCEASKCELSYESSPDPWDRETTTNVDEAGNSWLTEYRISLDLFNGKEIPVGLRDISVVASVGNREVVDHAPQDAKTADFSHGQHRYETVHVVNLPPRQWVHLELLGSLGRVEEVKGWHKIEFVGQRQRRGLFERREFRKTVDGC